MNLNKSLEKVTTSEEFSVAIQNFSDDFHASPSVDVFLDAPQWLRNRLDDHGLADTWVAALVSHLCQQYDLELPDWVHEPGRILKEPWFADGSEKMKIQFLKESPAAFRVRNLFVSAEVMSGH